MQIWASIIEYPFETTRVAAYLIYNEFMRKYPDIKWILAHAGGTLPYLSLRMQLMEEQDIHAPRSTTRARRRRALHRQVLLRHGDLRLERGDVGADCGRRPGHIMYGSDWPYIYRSLVEDQQITLEAELIAATFQAIERESALELFARFAQYEIVIPGACIKCSRSGARTILCPHRRAWGQTRRV